jgi:transposase-like protein
MYYEGLSEAEIRRNLIQQENVVVSTGSIYNWINRFTDLAVDQAKKCKPDFSGIAIADETVIDLDGKNVWFWDLIDAKTRFLIASHMSFTRTSKDAEELMKQVYERTGKIPRVIYTDKLRAYLEGIERVFGADTIHRQGAPFDIENNTNLIERFHSTIKSRTKVMRGLHTAESARRFMDGWLVHYNFFRPHMSLKDRTPASVAGIRFPFRNWKDVTEQPFEKTARIPMPENKPVILSEERLDTILANIERRPTRRIVEKQPRVLRRVPHATKPTPSLMQIRLRK